MRARDAVGRRIVAVEQERVPCSTSTSNEFVVAIRALLLDNGARIVFHAAEIEYVDPVPVAAVVKPRKPSK